jgi:hypothetical protein
MDKQFKKNFSIIRPDLQQLIDKKKGKKFKISKEFHTFNNNVWWKRLFRWIFYRKK